MATRSGSEFARKSLGFLYLVIPRGACLRLHIAQEWERAYERASEARDGSIGRRGSTRSSLRDRSFRATFASLFFSTRCHCPRSPLHSIAPSGFTSAGNGLAYIRRSGSADRDWISTRRRRPQRRLATRTIAPCSPPYSLSRTLTQCKGAADRTEGPDQAAPRVPLCAGPRLRRQLWHGPDGFPGRLQGKGTPPPPSPRGA